MKKKILFLMSGTDAGGVEKSLISLLHYFDYNKYEIYLKVANTEGIYFNQINKNVHVQNYGVPEYYFKHPKISLIALLKKRELNLFLYRFIAALISIFDKGYAAYFLSRPLARDDQKYDTIIDYGGQWMCYYMVDKLDALKKITYFHNDYRQWDFYKKTDKKYYGKVNNIVTVSESCKEGLIEFFPEYIKKISVIENIITKETVNFNAEKIDKIKSYGNKKIIVTVGRLVEQKGIDFAIKAMKNIVMTRKDIIWLWIGPGEIEKIQAVINENKVSENFILLGEKENPYKYIEIADIYCMPSRYEGKSIALEEAKIMQKPIVVTNFSTVNDQVIHEVNGIIVDLSADSISLAVTDLIDDKKKQQQLITYLSEHNKGNKEEVDKLYSIIEGEKR